MILGWRWWKLLLASPLVLATFVVILIGVVAEIVIDEALPALERWGRR